MTKTNDPRMSSKRFRARNRSRQTPTESMSMAERATLRPADYDTMSAQEQWGIDKSLGILDWDGKEES